MLLRLMLTMALLSFNLLVSYGQSNTKTISLKKGEVLDILLLNQNPNMTADLEDYFQTAFPVAKRMSYQQIPGFKVTNHTQGNFSPALLILGKWNNMELREQFLDQIVKEVPDFHERRRKIWSYFGLRYFEIKEDLSIEINRDKFHVATAYWLESKNETSEGYKKWKKNIQKMEGQILIELKDGKSPFGYQYNPDFFVITSWESKAAFKDFQDKILTSTLDNVEHINEFILK
ncbi:MAG: hypothetical protein AAFO07_25200 [Bacteroidota bacterium]